MADLFHIDRLPFESKSRVAGDHERAVSPREIGGQVVGDAIGEMLQLRVIREIGKRQHDDREPRHDGQSSRPVSILLLTRLADEADAFADDRADQPLLIASVADDPSDGVDTARKRRFRHDPPAPDRGQQIVLADHAIAISDQEHQQIEHLGLDRQQLRPPA
jgi:hypothetical protein